MALYNTNLLREKFVITDPRARTEEARKPVTALSNRIIVDLTSDDGKTKEIFVVRAHNMHMTTRMMARIIRAFRNGGPILDRATPFDWKAALDSITSDYEHTHNEELWVCVYNEGKIIFESGEHHILLDVIEKCEQDNDGAYEEAVVMAEAIFMQAGKEVNITYDGNVALVVDIKPEKARFGIILRGADRTTTFNFSVQPNKHNPELNVPQSLSAAAAYLEGVQLAFQVGMGNEKIRMGMIEKRSDEEKKITDGRRRLGRLAGEIKGLEDSFDVRFRPEKPELGDIVTEAEQLARESLRP